MLVSSSSRCLYHGVYHCGHRSTPGCGPPALRSGGNIGGSGVIPDHQLHAVGLFAVGDVVSPPPSIMAVEEPVDVAEDVVLVATGVEADIVVTDVGDAVVVGDITVTFIAAQTLRPLPRLPPHTYSSISHLQ